MSRSKREPRIVAELGRPETGEETAERLATGSRNYRSRKTLNNLVLSLLATLGLVLVIVLLVPRNDNPILLDVDYQETAAQLQTAVDEPLLSPVLPDTWRANAAEYRSGGSDGVSAWYIGLLTPENQFIGLTQGFDANPTWLSQQVGDTPVSQTLMIGGVQWDVYVNPETRDQGNFEYALVTESADSTYLLLGTAEPAEFAELARIAAPTILENEAS
jgi:hypothetical protein